MNKLSKYKIRKMIAENKKLEALLKQEKALCEFVKYVYENTSKHWDFTAHYRSIYAILESFSWGDTKQGNYYWLNLHEKLKNSWDQ